MSALWPASQKKIVFLFDNFELSGADRITMDVAQALAERGAPVELAACMDVKGGFGGIPDGLVRLSPPPAANEGLFQRSCRGVAAVRRCIGLARSSSVIVSVTPPAAFVALIASWFSACRSLPWVHYDLAGILREPLAARGVARGLIQLFFHRYLVPWHRRLIFSSEVSLQAMVQLTRRRSVPQGWIVLPNIVDATDRASRPHESVTLQRVADLKNQGFRILLFIGRLARQKRWEDLLAAAELLDGKAGRHKLVIIGDGPERMAFETALRRSSRGNVEYLGPDPNPMPALKIADALVLSSLYEAWPNVILEAFQLGVPVVSYDCPSGPREMIGANGERGWLVEESPGALALAAQRCLETGAEERARVTGNAREYSARFFPGSAAQDWLRYLGQG
jgi:glycosyltransferase involved in cell wall biosynthesis